MKQVQKTEFITAALRKSLGDGVALDHLRVYEAIALNTLPLRKNHPLYNGSRADRSLLYEMAAELNKESRPVHLMHYSDDLPVGRVFYGEVVDQGSEAELRVLFFLDPTADEEAVKIDSGSVDQVSVSVLPKHIYNSVSGFDYLGPDATVEHIMSGTDPDGNTLGKNGCYGRIVGLNKFFELSLVGMGGAQNARIISRDESHFGSSYQKLAASGLDPNALVLVASTSTRKEEMNLTEIIAQLTDMKAELAQKIIEISTLQAAIAEKDKRIAELEAKLEDVAKPQAELQEQIASLTTQSEEVRAQLDAAVTSLKDIATKVLTAAGKTTDGLPETVEELNAVINETTEALAASLVAGGRSKEATSDVSKDIVPVAGAFRVRW